MIKSQLLWIEQSRLDALFEQIVPPPRPQQALYQLPVQEELLQEADPPTRTRTTQAPPVLSYAPPFSSRFPDSPPASVVSAESFDSQEDLSFALPSDSQAASLVSLSTQTPSRAVSAVSSSKIQQHKQQEALERAQSIASHYAPFRQIKQTPPPYQPHHAVVQPASLDALQPKPLQPVGYLSDLAEDLEAIEPDEIRWNLQVEDDIFVSRRLPLAPIAPLWMPPPAPQRNAPIFLESEDLPKALLRFVEWLLPSTGACMAFLCDEQGLPLAQADAPEEALLWAPMLYAQIRSIAAAFPIQHQAHLAVRSLCLQIDPNFALSLFWLTTPLGPMTLGVVRPDPIEDITLCPFLGALQDTIARFA
ncbi:hypothetical protein L6R29_02040 [Myxococcota bacterium]|nr:hypothetical protein [Myxococcota bacterium]